MNEIDQEQLYNNLDLLNNKKNYSKNKSRELEEEKVNIIQNRHRNSLDVSKKK